MMFVLILTLLLLNCRVVGMLERYKGCELRMRAALEEVTCHPIRSHRMCVSQSEKR